MARRRIQVDGESWEVAPSGRVTVYDRDEFGLVFRKGSGSGAERRYGRYSPLGSRYREASLAELSDRQLVELFRQSQPEWTSPAGRLARQVRSEREGR
jgi:hypothetical protein